MLKEKIKDIFKNYWYYTGQWHNADCDFIRDDQGVCNCKMTNNRKAINNQILSAIEGKDIFKIMKKNLKPVAKELFKEQEKTNKLAKIIMDKKFQVEQQILDEIKNNPNWKSPLLKSWQERLKKNEIN